MSSMEQQDERRILGQMVRFQNQAAVRIDNDCVNGLGGTSPRSQGQDKENKALFHVPLLHTVVEPAQRRAVMDSVLPVKATGFKEPCGSYWSYCTTRALNRQRRDQLCVNRLPVHSKCARERRVLSRFESLRRFYSKRDQVR